MFEKICLILLLNLLFFFKTLCFRYSSDDVPVFSNPPKTKNIFHKAFLWLDGSYRSGPQVDHALTTVIHAVNAVLIYIGFGANDISFLAAILFSFNPTGSQGSVWISGRAYALSTFGMVGTLAFPGLAIFFLTICTYFNQGFVAPLALIGHSPLWVLACIPFAWLINGKRFKNNVKHKMTKEMYYEDKAIKPEKLILAVKSFGFYTLLCLFPFKNAFYHSFLAAAPGSGKERAYTMNDRFFFVGLIFIIAFASYFILVPWDMVSFGLLWWIICIGPFLNLFRMQQEIAERYTYLPSAGLMFALASFLQGHPILISAFITLYASRLWFYMDGYADDYYLLEQACLDDPMAWFAWHMRGMNRFHCGSPSEAVILWTRARMLSPNEFKVNFNLATALAMSGHKKEADFFYKLACNNVPKGQEEETKEIIAKWKEGMYAIIV